MEHNDYTYNARVVRVIDGDTVVVNIDLGLDVWKHDQHLRLRGIDAAEVRTRDAVEKAAGLEAKAFLKTLLPPGEPVVVTTFKDRTTFGRYVADVALAGADIGAIMVEKGLATVHRY